MAWTAFSQPRPPDQVSVWNSLLLHFKFWLLGENLRNGSEQLGEVESSHVPTGGHLAIVDAEELSHWIDLRVQGTWETQLFSPQTELPWGEQPQSVQGMAVRRARQGPVPVQAGKSD